MYPDLSDGGGIPGTGNGGSAAASAGSPTSPTPSSGTPPSTPSSTPDTGGGAAESMDFESMFSGPSDAVDLGLTEPTPSTPSPGPTAPPAAPSAQPTPQQAQVPPQAPAQAPPQAPPAQQPQGAAQAPPPGGAVPPGLDRYDPAQLAAALTANEPQLLEVLATQVLALSPQEVEALQTDVTEAIPRIAARVLLQAQKSALTQMANLIPVMVQRQLMESRRANSAEGEFYKAWPGLNPRQHGQLVRSYASVFRRMYPQATLRDIVQHVGPMVMAATRTPMPQPGQQQTPTAPRRGANGGRPPPPSPFVPAGGAAPVPGATGRELSPWEAMFAEQG